MLTKNSAWVLIPSTASRPGGRGTMAQIENVADTSRSASPAVQRGAVTELLNAWGRGDLGARDQLLPLVYGELRRQAASHLRRERHGHTLSATALVHESYLRLVGQCAGYQNRAHFFALVAQMMRRVLVDHARARAAAKRPRPLLMVTLEEEMATVEPRTVEVLSMDEALTLLAAFAPRQARLIELRFFGGLTSAEIAEVLGISSTTLKRDWNLAKAWLYRHLTAPPVPTDAEPPA
jgi:RNA polymerase sigma-70 factor (ECF subfamily)